MKLKMSRQEFLSRWRALRGYAPLRNDVSLSRSDGLDFDARLEAEMDGWYRRLVLEGDEPLLAPEELAADVSLSAPADGCVTLTLPPHVARGDRRQAFGLATARPPLSPTPSATWLCASSIPTPGPVRPILWP